MTHLRLIASLPILLAGLALAKPPTADILRANIDPTVSPAVDFFAYANGGWLKRNPIPASESYWGIGELVDADLYQQLRTISETNAKKSNKPGSDEQKVGDFWRTAMDTARAERLGLTPLQPELDKIDAINDASDALDVAFHLQRLGIDALFDFGISQDAKKSDLMAVQLNQGGIGLPDRDFYFNKEAGVTKIRAEYLKHLEAVLTLLGQPDAKAAAASVMAFETALAQRSRKIEDLRDPLRNYNKLTVDALTKDLTPSILWADRFEAWHIHPKDAIVGQPEFFKSLDTLVGNTPIGTLQNYYRCLLIHRFAPYLNAKVETLDYQFYHGVLSGQKVQRPRWKRVIDTENSFIGFLLGRAFVKTYFPPQTKKRYTDLVEAIRSSYRNRIEHLDWMSPATKKKALEKLSAVGKKIGYPDKWKDYSKLTIGTESYALNMLNAFDWSFDYMLAKYGKPVDRTEWDMTPQTFNAYYDPSNNEIVFPAAAFTIPGKKDSELDDAIIYGNAAASYMGHEITHGFDDEGRQFDAKGNLRDWWTKEDAKRFNQRAAVMVKQFNAYQPLPGLHINGKASLGENIADYGGLLIGLDAFKKTAQYKRGKKIAGFTPLQRFFLAYTLSWLGHERPQSLRRQLLSDVHAPAKWRVLGPLSNMPDFYRAFHVKPGQPMWRPAKDRVSIW
jgi:putative endopeptidase